jgi:hypothetical protein
MVENWVLGQYIVISFSTLRAGYPGTAVLECCTSTRVQNLVPLLNLALTWCHSSTSTGGPVYGVRSDIYKPKLVEPHLYCCAGAARSSL